MKTLIRLFLICAVAAGTAVHAFAAPEEAAKPKIETLKISGPVSAVSSSGIAVQYGMGKDAAKEIYLPISGKTQFQRFQSPAQLKVGDTVQVVYERKYQEPEKGKKVYLDAMATEVTLVKQAAGDGALSSRGEGAK